MQHHVLFVLLLYWLCSLPVQILMSVSWVVSMTVMKMLTASIPLEVTTAAVTLAMREMDSTAQVLQSCEVHYTYHYANNVDNCWYLGVHKCVLIYLSGSADINECELEIHICHSEANCTDTDGSFNCTCREGFEGDGFNCAGIKHILHNSHHAYKN